MYNLITFTKLIIFGKILTKILYYYVRCFNIINLKQNKFYGKLFLLKIKISVLVFFYVKMSLIKVFMLF
jgi:hypothetical protein